VLTVCVQGSLIALVNDRDMARLIASHKNMIRLLGSAAPALVSTSDTAILDGEGAHMGAGLQVVEAVPFDQSVLLDAIKNVNITVNTHTTQLNEKTIIHVDKVVKKECDARKKDIKDVKEAMQAQNEALQQRLALLEQGAACNKRPRDAPNDAPKQANNITWNKAKDSFGWMKMVKGVSNGSKGFSSAEEAALDMQRFYVVAVQGSVPMRGSLV